MSSIISTIPSCGTTLLQAHRDTFDYVLTVYDSQKKVTVFVHRCVLLAHSKKMRELINDENYFSMSIKIKDGYLPAMLELIQYLYLKDPGLVTHKDKILEVCGLLQMDLEHFMIRTTQKADTVNMLKIADLYFQNTDEPYKFSIDFLKLLKWQGVEPNYNKLCTTTTTNTTPKQPVVKTPVGKLSKPTINVRRSKRKRK